MPVGVSNGEGGHGRFVPLAPRVLALRRGYGRHSRPRLWLFPARHRPTRLPPTFTVVVRPSGPAKAASSHPRRHASAPHLPERGVPPRAMQARHGPKSPGTTACSTHLTPKPLGVVHAAIHALLADP